MVYEADDVVRLQAALATAEALAATQVMSLAERDLEIQRQKEELASCWHRIEAMTLAAADPGRTGAAERPPLSDGGSASTAATETPSASAPRLTSSLRDHPDGHDLTREDLYYHRRKMATSSTLWSSIGSPTHRAGWVDFESCRVGGGFSILPDIAQVHSTLASIADNARELLREEALSAMVAATSEGRKWMFYLMPVWQPSAITPLAQEFWRLAHTAARDQSGDDWIAPHVTLHSRSLDLAGLLGKFTKMMRDVGRGGWSEINDALSSVLNWNFAEDKSSEKRKPSAKEQYILHKARIVLPCSLRQWLFENQDARCLGPRKQDAWAAERRRSRGRGDASDPAADDERIPIVEPFHISLYSFRAAHDITAKYEAADREPSQDPSTDRHNSLGRHSTSYGHAVPKDAALRADLATADWMLVFAAPGKTGETPQSPQILLAVRIRDLAAGLLEETQESSTA